MNDAKTKSIGKVAELTGISERALRHYEAMGLVSPARTANGYRAYRPADERRLMQILAMRSCGLSLATIGDLLHDDRNLREVLTDHLQILRSEISAKQQAEEKTLAALQLLERLEGMETKDAFEEMKSKVSSISRTPTEKKLAPFMATRQLMQRTSA